jgi:hypothetical protein
LCFFSFIIYISTVYDIYGRFSKHESASPLPLLLILLLVIIRVRVRVLVQMHLGQPVRVDMQVAVVLLLAFILPLAPFPFLLPFPPSLAMPVIRCSPLYSPLYPGVRAPALVPAAIFLLLAARLLLIRKCLGPACIEP